MSNNDPKPRDQDVRESVQIAVRVITWACQGGLFRQLTVLATTLFVAFTLGWIRFRMNPVSWARKDPAYWAAIMVAAGMSISAAAAFMILLRRRSQKRGMAAVTPND